LIWGGPGQFGRRFASPHGPEIASKLWTWRPFLAGDPFRLAGPYGPAPPVAVAPRFLADPEQQQQVNAFPGLPPGSLSLTSQWISWGLALAPCPAPTKEGPFFCSSFSCRVPPKQKVSMMIYESSLSRSGSKKVSETVQVQPPAKRKGARGNRGNWHGCRNCRVYFFLGFC